jgi:preprotein translocase subunit SecY
MASAAEQLAANFRFDSFFKAGDLRDRLLFTLGALLIYRLGTYVPLPGIDADAMAQLFGQMSGGILGNLNLFAGGAVSRMSVFALSILPYISASIIMQLMQAVSPTLEAMKKEGEAGRRKLNQYTRYLTVVLAMGQALGIAFGLENSSSASNPLVTDPGLFFRIQTVVTLTGGTVFLMWLGEQITSRGIGNGISLLIFTGIIAQMPQALGQILETVQQTDQALLSLLVVVVVIALVFFVVFIERSFRQIVVQYPKRVVGNRQTEGQTQYLPLKLNTVGVIPVIFASSLLIMPQTIVSFGVGVENEWLNLILQQLGRGQIGFILLFGALIMFFAFFYTAIVFNPNETAENLKKGGGYVPGVRPGKNTAIYLDYVLSRLTVVGAVYLAFVALLPEIWAGASSSALIFGGTSILIVVSVTIDTVQQIQSHMIAQQYESLLAKQRLRSGDNKDTPKKTRRRTRR